MGFLELFFIAVGLAMDAFAVSICKGLSVGVAKPKYILCVGLYFGGFQALMPTIGYFVGVNFKGAIQSCGSLDRIYSAGHHRRKYDPGVQRRRGMRGCTV